MEHKIFIEHGNTSNDTLILNPSGIIKVEKGDTVIWTISSNAVDVKSFKIKKKKDSPEIFSIFNQPPSLYTDKGEGRISKYAGDDAVYDYWIHWKDHDNNKHPFDPKIAVNPDRNHSKNLIIGTIIGLLGILSLSLLIRKRSKK